MIFSMSKARRATRQLSERLKRSCGLHGHRSSTWGREDCSSATSNLTRNSALHRVPFTGALLLVRANPLASKSAPPTRGETAANRRGRGRALPAAAAGALHAPPTSAILEVGHHGVVEEHHSTHNVADATEKNGSINLCWHCRLPQKDLLRFQILSEQPVGVIVCAQDVVSEENANHRNAGHC